MKVKLTPDGRPLITLGKADEQRIRSAYEAIDQLAHHGRRGCQIGETLYGPRHFLDLANVLARLLDDAAGKPVPPVQEKPPALPPQGDGPANAANSQPPTTPVAPKKGALSC